MSLLKICLQVSERRSKDSSLGRPSECKSRRTEQKTGGKRAAKIGSFFPEKNHKEMQCLQVKIQKMRSNLEEKLMKRMAIVHRRAKECRAAAQLQHSQQLLRAYEQAQKIKIQQKQQQQQASLFTDHTSCGCFSCSTII